MDKPVVAGKSPIAVDLKKGETYYYCTCSKSDNQPFCNGAHQGASFEPWVSCNSRRLYDYYNKVKNNIGKVCLEADVCGGCL